MGRIAAKNKQPSCKFVFPHNNDATLKENQPFTLKMKINNVQTGLFANPAVKYYSAPQVRHHLLAPWCKISLNFAPLIDRQQRRDH